MYDNREPLKQLDVSMDDGDQDADDSMNLTPDSDDENNTIDDFDNDTMEDNPNPEAQFVFQNLNQDIDFDLNSVLRQNRPNNLGEQGMATYLREESLTAKCIINLFNLIKKVPKESVDRDPAGLKPGVKLMSHQKYALKWMRWREEQEIAPGGILGKKLFISIVLMLK